MMNGARLTSCKSAKVRSATLWTHTANTHTQNLTNFRRTEHPCLSLGRWLAFSIVTTPCLRERFAKSHKNFERYQFKKKRKLWLIYVWRRTVFESKTHLKTSEIENLHLIPFNYQHFLRFVCDVLMWRYRCDSLLKLDVPSPQRLLWHRTNITTPTILILNMYVCMNIPSESVFDKNKIYIFKNWIFLELFWICVCVGGKEK